MAKIAPEVVPAGRTPPALSAHDPSHGSWAMEKSSPDRAVESRVDRKAGPDRSERDDAHIKPLRRAGDGEPSLDVESTGLGISMILVPRVQRRLRPSRGNYAECFHGLRPRSKAVEPWHEPLSRPCRGGSDGIADVWLVVRWDRGRKSSSFIAHCTRAIAAKKHNLSGSLRNRVKVASHLASSPESHGCAEDERNDNRRGEPQRDDQDGSPHQYERSGPDRAWQMRFGPAHPRPSTPTDDSLGTHRFQPHSGHPSIACPRRS